MCKATHVME